MLNTAPHIREATTDDIAAMHAIRVGVRENRLSDPSWLTHEVWSSCLAGRSPANTWVSVSDGKVVGFSVARIAEADIWALFVDRVAQGRNHGKNLLRVASDWPFAQGVVEIRLSTTVDTRADAFYRQQGWRRGEFTSKGEVVYRLQDNRITQE
jgi:GNAT superfamily N-acetyltransferase